MRTVLRAKRVYDNDQVTAVCRDIESYVTAEEAWAAVEAAATEVRQVVGRDTGRVVYGWSGGKDSQALRVVMERAGVHRAVLGTVPALEFRSYLQWVDAHGPDGLEVIENRDLDLAWLGQRRNARYLFPRTARDGYFWTLAGTRRAQLIYQGRHSPVLQVYGRRTADGNVIGTGPYGIAKSKRLTVYCPLRTWPHELVLAVVHYAGMPLPPTYDWPHGWTAGTGPWPGRRVGTPTESWAETYAIEPERVHEAAAHVLSAREWLSAVGC